MAMDSQPIIIKKKKAHGHAHHGGSWKVAYADFVTAMMAFFMVMWIMGLSDETKASVAGYFKDPFGFVKTMPKESHVIDTKGLPEGSPGNTKSRGKDPTTLEEKKLKGLRDEIRHVVEQTPELATMKQFVTMELTKEGLRIEFVEGAGAVFFESGSSHIRSNAEQLVKRIAPILAKTKRGMIIEGHTDAKPYASNEYTNLDLSTDRARAMRQILSRYGVPLGQFRALRGLGDTNLRDPSQPYSFVNRRVTLLIPTQDPKAAQDGLPADVLKNEIQGAFRKDKFEIAPHLNK